MRGADRTRKPTAGTFDSEAPGSRNPDGGWSDRSTRPAGVVAGGLLSIPDAQRFLGGVSRAFLYLEFGRDRAVCQHR